MSTHLLASIRASNPSGVPDRRITERKLCRVSGLLYAAGYAPMRIKTIDLSMKGVGLLLPQSLPSRTVCDLGFHLHLNGLLRKITAKIEISNSVFLRSDVRTGCRFLFLDEESRNTLADFLR